MLVRGFLMRVSEIFETLTLVEKIKFGIHGFCIVIFGIKFGTFGALKPLFTWFHFQAYSISVFQTII